MDNEAIYHKFVSLVCTCLLHIAEGSADCQELMAISILGNSIICTADVQN